MKYKCPPLESDPTHSPLNCVVAFIIVGMFLLFSAAGCKSVEKKKLLPGHVEARTAEIVLPPMPPTPAAAIRRQQLFAVPAGSAGTISVDTSKRVQVHWTKASGRCTFWISDALNEWREAGSFVRQDTGPVIFIDDSDRTGARFYKVSTTTP